MSQLSGLKKNLQTEIPRFHDILPSTGEKIVIKPFKVAEEKILMMAAESKDPVQMVLAFENILENCVERKSTHSLSYFDFEYLFIKIRSKSIGESVTFGYKCTQCENVQDVKIDLSNISVKTNPDHTRNIKITDDLMFGMKYPTVEMIYNSVSGSYENILKLLIDCVEKVYSGEDVIEITEAEKNDLKEIIESLTADQFKGLSDFLDTMPKMKEETGFTCNSCGHENKIVLEGIKSFF